MNKVFSATVRLFIRCLAYAFPVVLVFGAIEVILAVIELPLSIVEIGGGVPIWILGFGLCAVFYYLVNMFIRKCEEF